ncbi:MAG: right-handed parallel beta-helix repeat-containing protein [Acidimicrobiales bacterium]
MRLRWGLVGLLLVLSTAFVAPGEAQTGPVDVCQYAGGRTDAFGGPLYNGSDPTRQFLTKISPFRLTKYPCNQPVAYRAAQLKPGRVDLIEGGQLVGRNFIGYYGTPVPFERLAAILARWGWAAEPEPGVFELSAALVQAPGTSVVFAAPRVKTLRLISNEGVFIGGHGAVARFEGVAVTSWKPDGTGPDNQTEIEYEAKFDARDRGLPIPSDNHYRPFVVYSEGSRLEIVRSQMSHLGSDRTDGYGISWGSDSTGQASESTFDHNFFGIFTSAARDVAFQRNLIRDNVYYGWDPHTSSRNLLAEDNEAYGNGSHGFIVSESVVNSVIRNNRSHDNGRNGIVIDRSSSGNLIEGNIVENNGLDGIVITRSANNVVRGNVIRNQATGVRVNGLDSNGNTISNNRIERTHTGIHAYGGTADLTLDGNTIVETTGTAMVMEAARSTITGGEIRRAAKGIDIRSFTRVSGVAMSDVDQGVRVTGTGIAQVDGIEVDARAKPVQVAPDGFIDLARSTLRSATFTSAPRRPWMPLIGAGSVSVAVLLQGLSRRRRRDADRLMVAPPPGIWNTA